MPAPTADLARREGVELVRTGNFQTLTGSWNPTPADIKAAVEAMACPAIRKPVIRLGHRDNRFVGDGEPALGWFENLRASDDGNTLLADQVTLPWLHSVQAAAYPSRSVEGNYHHRCSEGHTHPFVIHTVALLGVTPPGVQTLKSINDLPEFLGVAASEAPEGAQRVQVTILAADTPTPDGDDDDDDEPSGVMVALIPTAADAARLTVDGGLPAEELHLTLAYLGDAANLGTADRQKLIDVVSSTVNGLPVVDGEIFSVAVYNPGDVTDRDACLVYQVSADLLGDLQDAVDDALGDPDLSPEPWFAHITAIYSDDLGRLTDLIGNIGPVSFDRVRIAIAGQAIDIPLIDGDDTPTRIPMPMGDYPADPVMASAVSDKAWNPKQGDYTPAQWKTACLIDKGTGDPESKARYALPVREPDGTVNRNAVHAAVGRLNQVNASPAAKKATAKALIALYADLGEKPPPSLHMVANKKVAASNGGTPELPAAEPEPENTDPKEDHVSTDLSAFRSRLGLDDTADEQAITAAIDALKVKAETPQPTPEMVAASAAVEAEKTELQTTVDKLGQRLEAISGELATVKAEKSATVKASVIDDAVKAGKIKPADKAQWESDYDEAPGVTTRILASIAPGTAVPVMASGVAGSPEPQEDMDAFERDMVRLDGPVYTTKEA